MNKYFFCINPKSYLQGEKLFEFAGFANNLAKQYDFDIYFTCPTLYLSKAAEQNQNLKITAQKVDAYFLRDKMDNVEIKNLKEIGVQAIVVNHASLSIDIKEVKKLIELCKQNKLVSIVCAGELNEIEYFAKQTPSIIVCEKKDLIGKGIQADDEYMLRSKRIIEYYSKSIGVSQSAGIRNGKDILKAFKNGANGTGVTSGIFLSENPKLKLIEFLEATKLAIAKYGG